MAGDRTDEFTFIFATVEDARERAGEDVTIAIESVQTQTERMSELMAIAQQLAEPRPQYFTRG